MHTSFIMTGPHNLVTDVPGVLVGNAHDERLASGVTVALFEEAAVASGIILGGAAANRDTACLEPEAAVERVNGIVLSGGSGFGLDAASGVQAWMRERSIGIAVGRMRVPATRTGAAIRLTASSATRPQIAPGRRSPSARPAAATAPRRSISRAGLARRARSRPPASSSGRSSW
jgi:L-aminopeptidase/D-esterase-like protein